MSTAEDRQEEQAGDGGRYRSRIRLANRLDEAHIYAMTHRFIRSTSYARVFRAELVTSEVLAPLMLMLMENGQGAIFLAEQALVNAPEGWAPAWMPVGMIAGVAGPHPVTGEQCVEEMAWWMDEHARGGRLAYKLLGHLEEWARQRGAVMLKMVAPIEETGECPVGRHYERLGYVPIETAYLKRF